VQLGFLLARFQCDKRNVFSWSQKTRKRVEVGKLFLMQIPFDIGLTRNTSQQLGTCNKILQTVFSMKTFYFFDREARESRTRGVGCLCISVDRETDAIDTLKKRLGALITRHRTIFTFLRNCEAADCSCDSHFEMTFEGERREWRRRSRRDRLAMRREAHHCLGSSECLFTYRRLQDSYFIFALSSFLAALLVSSSRGKQSQKKKKTKSLAREKSK
jgi:hypothetical protein